MSTSFWLDRTFKTPAKTYDVVIVGAGISGLSAAYWLKKEDPGLKIAIVERTRMGGGATGRNAGFITCGSVEHFNRLITKHGLEEATDIWRFSEENLRLLEEQEVRFQALRDALIAGEESGSPKPFDGEAFLKRLHDKHTGQKQPLSSHATRRKRS